MKHARKDYDRIQDPAGLIPADEPVFLLRGKDVLAPEIVRERASEAEKMGVEPRMVEAAREQAREMDRWQREHGTQVPDMPKEA